MLHCCSNKHNKYTHKSGTHTHTHVCQWDADREREKERGRGRGAGEDEGEKIKTVYKTQSKRQQEKVGAAYFLYKLMLRLTVETCNKNDSK